MEFQNKKCIFQFFKSLTKPKFWITKNKFSQDPIIRNFELKIMMKNLISVISDVFLNFLFSRYTSHKWTWTDLKHQVFSKNNRKRSSEIIFYGPKVIYCCVKNLLIEDIIFITPFEITLNLKINFWTKIRYF